VQHDCEKVKRHTNFLTFSVKTWCVRNLTMKGLEQNICNGPFVHIASSFSVNLNGSIVFW
jgi:hypothetical protein